MRKIFLLILVLSFTLTSCIEIVEEITVNSDQSGSISYKLETEGMGSFFSNISGLFNSDLENQMKEQVMEFARKLEGMKGISNLEYIAGARKAEFELRADFNNTKNLNKALYQAFGYKKKAFSPGYINVSKHKFKRNNIAPYLKAYLEDQEFQMPGEQMLEFVKFRTIVKLPTKVKSYKPSGPHIVEDRQTLSISYPIDDIINNKTSMKFKVRY